MRIALEIYLDKSLSIQDSFLIAFSKTEKMELKTFDKKALKAFQNLS
jgi:predicted nucleic acid-binding protein